MSLAVILTDSRICDLKLIENRICLVILMDIVFPLPNENSDTKVERLDTIVLYDLILRRSEVCDECHTFLIYELSSRIIIKKHQRANRGPVAINFLRKYDFDLEVGDLIHNVTQAKDQTV